MQEEEDCDGDDVIQRNRLGQFSCSPAKSNVANLFIYIHILHGSAVCIMLHKIHCGYASNHYLSVCLCG